MFRDCFSDLHLRAMTAADACGTDWQKEAGGLTCQCVGMLLSLLVLSAPLTATAGPGASLRGSFSREAKPPVQLLLA